MIQITDNAREQRLTPILRQAFRPFFFFATLFSVLAIGIWALVLSGLLQITPYGNVFFWHQHEMLFGFVAAIIVGFLLTAVQNWTGMRATHGWPLLLLLLLWCAGRILMFIPALEPSWIAAAVDLAFLPVAAVFFARLVWPSQRWQNFVFIPMLLLLTSMNFVMHVGVAQHDMYLQQWGAYGAVLLITTLMTIIGGRVIPMFTANGTRTPRVTHLLWLDTTAIGASWLIAILYVFNLKVFLSKEWLVACFGVAAILHGIRALRWRPQVTLKVPLVWSLHLAYWFIPVGYGLMALSFVDESIRLSTALHALTVGAMGGLILAMIARVSLGHTGRVLQLKPVMIGGFILIFVAAGLRVLTHNLSVLTPTFWLVSSALFWVLAYSLFLLCYRKVLWRPRADQAPG